MTVSSQRTRTKILDVAEELFGEHGLDRVSIRDITERAEANIAAVNYHFGGKEELIAAVFERRIKPVNRERMRALTDLEGNNEPPRVEEILGAFIRPAVAGCLNDAKGTRSFARLFGRCLAETRPEVETLLRKQFRPLADRMEKALTRALPSLSREDIFWRLKFTFGALHHWLLTKDRWLPEWAEKTDLEAQTEKLISFAAAGFKAK